MVLGDFLGAVVVSPDGRRVYVTNWVVSETVNDVLQVISIVDHSTAFMRLIDRIPEPAYTLSLAPDGNTLYALSSDPNPPFDPGVAVIDLASKQVLARIPVSGIALDVNASGTRLYVINISSQAVRVIDTGTRRVIAAIPVGSGPWELGRFVGPDLPEGTPSPTPVISCPGDCNDDGRVGVDELVMAVEITLNARPPADCLASDGDGNGVVTVDEVLRAVKNALNGCPP